MVSRIREIEIQVRLSGKGAGMRGAEATNTAPNALDLRDSGFGAVEGSIQLLLQIWADGFAPVLNVDGSDFLDLLQGQPERAKANDHLPAP